MITFALSLLLLVATAANAVVTEQSTSTLLRVKEQRDVATLHRDALIDAVHQKARKLVDSTSENGGIFGDGKTFCNYFEEGMSFEDIDDEVTGDCSCSGTIADTLELTCSFQNVCGEREEICGSVNFVIKMSNLVDGEGNLGGNPEMEIQACVDVEWLEEMCLTLYFAGLDFVVPVQCDFTYDNQPCICNIDTVKLDETFDLEVPCMDWNCTEVVPELLKPYMAENNCDLFSETNNESISATQPALASFSTLEEIPQNVVTELEAGSGAYSFHWFSSGLATFFAFSAAFLA